MYPAPRRCTCNPLQLSCPYPGCDTVCLVRMQDAYNSFKVWARVRATVRAWAWVVLRTEPIVRWVGWWVGIAMGVGAMQRCGCRRVSGVAASMKSLRPNRRPSFFALT